MKENIIYNEWLPYTDYEKEECDVKLKDGTIVYHCWPNAGKFNPLCSGMEEVMEEDVVEIMYRKYYKDDLCKSNCNGDGGKSKIKFIETKEYTPEAIDTFMKYEYWSNYLYGEPRVPFTRSEPKIGRNQECPCNSGKKYKKCCI